LDDFKVYTRIGSSYSHLEVEKKRTWTEHTLHYDQYAREKGLKMLNNIPDDETIFIGYVD
jgi:hypothetical protein